ncbi:MAG TPA: hypothetical protein VFN67_14940 [Polyangiales bacterium]|nr:hypothetical protein [Polyangiales bacterium]
MAKSTKRVRVLRSCALITQAAAFCVLTACASTPADDGQGQMTGTAMTPTQTVAGTPSTAAAAGAKAAAPGTMTAVAGKPASSAAPGAATAGSRASGTAGTSAAAAAGTSASATAGTSAAAGSGTSAAAGTSGGAAGGGASGGAATWTMVYDALFASSAMAGCGACHGGAANPSLNGGFGGLMTKDAAYMALVGKTSSTTMCTGKTYVVAGMPEMSLLYQKVAAAPMCGMRMPPGSTLPMDKVDLIKAWIMAGALDN